MDTGAVIFLASSIGELARQCLVPVAHTYHTVAIETLGWAHLACFFMSATTDMMMEPWERGHTQGACPGDIPWASNPENSKFLGVWGQNGLVLVEELIDDSALCCPALRIFKKKI